MNEPIDILLVEDNANDVELTLHAFGRQKRSNRFHVARDGAEALDFVFCRGPYHDRDLNHPPKLILLDLKLPKVDGLEVLRAIKSDARTKAIPVVVLTSSSVERDIATSYERGANSYIVKPVNFDEFMTMVNALAANWLQFNKTVAGQDCCAVCRCKREEVSSDVHLPNGAAP
jgi:two-component system response regulator